MGLLDKLFGKSEDNKRADIELRFERIRSAISGIVKPGLDLIPTCVFSR